MVRRKASARSQGSTQDTVKEVRRGMHHLRDGWWKEQDESSNAGSGPSRWKDKKCNTDHARVLQEHAQLDAQAAEVDALLLSLHDELETDITGN